MNRSDDLVLMRTVTGDRIMPVQVVTLPHEHLHVGLPPEKNPAPRRMLTSGEEAAEIAAFLAPLSEYNVGLFVDCTAVGVGRDPSRILAVSRRLGLPMVASTGLWKERGHPGWVAAMDTGELAERFIGEIEHGMEGTGIRAGLIKVGSNDPMTTEEEKAFRAAARAQRRTGVTITTHTEAGRIGLRQLEILLSEGVPPERIIIGHLDTSTDLDYHAEIAAAGAYIEFDRIGAPIGPADEQRALLVLAALERGYGNQVLLSHDAHALQLVLNAAETPRPMTTLFETFLPLLRERGVPPGVLEQIITVNPMRAIGRPQHP